MMKRRHFLGITAASAVILAGRSPASSGTLASSPTMLSIVLTDISAEPTRDFLIETVQELVSNGIGITCGLVLPSAQDMERQFLETYLALAALGDSVEFALHIPELDSKSTYFQARSAYEAIKKFSKILASNEAKAQILTIICNENKASVEPTGARVSGVRNILVQPTHAQKTRSETWPNGIVRFFGGQLAKIDRESSALPDPTHDENIQLYYISAKDFPPNSGPLDTSGRTQLVNKLLTSQMNGQTSLMSISDLQLRDDFRYQRRIVIIIETAEDPSQQTINSIAAFQSELRSVGIPSDVKGAGQTYWVQRTESAELISLSIDYDIRSDTYFSTLKPVIFGFGLKFSTDRDREIGIDGFSMLRLPIKTLPPNDPSQTIDSQLETADDIILSIPSDQIETSAMRAIVVARILSLGADGVSKFTELFEFLESVYPQGFIEKRFQLTLVEKVNARLKKPQRVDEAERSRLMVDAQRAWTYFEKYTNSVTGLCPSTVDARQDGDILQAVTMWDVGSNINALVAATQIGLITEKYLYSAIKRILPNIKGRISNGIKLPPGWMKTDKVRSGNRNFDGCDTGRLLSALDNFSNHYGMRQDLESIVSGWDLEKVILNREIHSIVDGKLQSTFSSHCGHYAALAFRRWDFDVASPYETFSGQAPADGEMQLLETASKIGAFGAEPLLLEAMELGMSKESAFLAEVLFTAQKEEFESTGRLICVSETPIDVAPWFIYEGLQVGSGLRDWRLNGDGSSEDNLAPVKNKDTMVFVTKAAFLWAAFKPSSHSTRLLNFARANSAGDIGFSSNVNPATQSADLKYTDINTNAVILQSIAHLLKT